MKKIPSIFLAARQALAAFLSLLLIAGCASVNTITVPASTEEAANFGIVKHQRMKDRKNQVLSIGSFDRDERLVAEVMVTGKDTALRRYEWLGDTPKLTDEMIIDYKGAQVSLSSGNEVEFRRWAGSYLTLLSSTITADQAAYADECQSSCDKDLARCNLSTIGSLAGTLFCWGKYFVCSMKCPPDFGETYGTGGGKYPSHEPGSPLCGNRKCTIDQQCCPGDPICISTTQKCR
jgi:hypothetical protein